MSDGLGAVAAEFDRAVGELRRGNPVIFPTDTVVGLGVAIEHCESPAVLARLKGRPADKPIAWLVSGVEALRIYGEDVPQAAFDAVESGWPGALTVIVKAGARVPVAYRSAAGTIGLRMPAGETALALIHAVESPLAATSANLAGQEPPQSVADVAWQLRRSAFAMECSEQGAGVASRVIDFTADPPAVLR